MTVTPTVNYSQMSDNEIIKQCIEFCNIHQCESKAVKAITDWSGTAPSINYNHHGSKFTFQGMISSPKRKTLLFSTAISKTLK
jgi:hypothetical protein